MLFSFSDCFFEQGIEPGREEFNLRSVQNLMKNLQMSPEQAMTVPNLSDEEREYCQKALASSAG